MEFLKEILGDDLFKQVETKVTSYNEKAENKDNQIKIANLGTGEYVSKSKFDTTQTELKNTKDSLNTATATITDLKKNNADNADLQAKITKYETQIADMTNKNKEETTKMVKEIAIKDALYNEKAKHPELLLNKFDLSKIVLDENGEKVVSGIEEQMKTNKETYKDLFGEENNDSSSTYHYSPANGTNNSSSGAVDFVGIIKENQARKV